MLDINATCIGFTYVLNIANGFIIFVQNKKYELLVQKQGRKLLTTETGICVYYLVM